ncbi:hypothetical protein HBI25_250990, partial [Parastagonospora nodorum]
VACCSLVTVKISWDGAAPSLTVLCPLRALRAGHREDAAWRDISSALSSQCVSNHGVIVVVFVGPGRCSTVSHRLSPSPPPHRRESCAQGTRRMLRGGVRAALSSMLFGCGVVVVVFVGPGRCSTVPRRPHLPLRVPGAGYWRVCRLGVMSPASSG